MQGAFGAGMQQMGIAPGQGGAGRPTLRNPIMTLLLPIGLSVVGNIVGSILVSITDVGALGLVGSLISLVGSVLALMAIIKMTNELKAVTGNTSFPWWPIFIPIYGLYWAVVMVPQEMAKAKQMRGVQTPPRGLVVYLFLFLYAYAADLNDIAKAP
ncbi:hypothetical protein AKJ09_11321 [Labilithrix luteola]|uniref:Uncharacterized protein n=2 Tax=Labilithrix luteola TaxID=1391654 RepID=A0A0K1QG09_9BACT|nr:hypothetical protein AKJ09_11321 [Labilithrix luteola]